MVTWAVSTLVLAMLGVDRVSQSNKMSNGQFILVTESMKIGITLGREAGAGRGSWTWD